MDLMPPTSTSRVMTASTRPVIHTGTPKDDSTFAEIELPWVMLPIPKDASTAAIAKNRERNFPKPLGMPRNR